METADDVRVPPRLLTASMVQLTDSANQTLWVQPRAICAVCIPSLLTPGNEPCRVLLTGAVVIVTRAEAERLVERLSHPVYADLEVVQ